MIIMIMFLTLIIANSVASLYYVKCEVQKIYNKPFSLWGGGVLAFCPTPLCVGVRQNLRCYRLVLRPLSLATDSRSLETDRLSVADMLKLGCCAWQWINAGFLRTRRCGHSSRFDHCFSASSASPQRSETL